MRLLLVTNKVRTYALGFQNLFSSLLRLGHEIVWAADFSYFIGDKTAIPCIVEQININTNPFNPSNIKAYFQILEIIDKYEIEGLLCSTPIGGALGRLTAKKRNINPVWYAAHGFLFFEGAPLINRTVYKWEEIILAHFTDILITITEEDYLAAQKLKLRSGKKPFLVHGAGVKVGVSVDIDRREKRSSIGVPEDAFVIVSAGELNKNKNTEVIVKALKKTGEVHYVVCGEGPEKDNLKKLAHKLGVADRFHLLGYRTDIQEIMACADAFTMMSFREGMPRALLEAMDLGLPCIGSDTRGIRDLIDKEGGFICKPTDAVFLAEVIRKLQIDPKMRKMMGNHNKSKVQEYSIEVVQKELFNICKEAFGNSKAKL